MNQIRVWDSKRKNEKRFLICRAPECGEIITPRCKLDWRHALGDRHHRQTRKRRSTCAFGILPNKQKRTAFLVSKLRCYYLTRCVVVVLLPKNTTTERNETWIPWSSHIPSPRKHSRYFEVAFAMVRTAMLPHMPFRVRRFASANTSEPKSSCHNSAQLRSSSEQLRSSSKQRRSSSKQLRSSSEQLRSNS